MLTWVWRLWLWPVKNNMSRSPQLADQWSGVAAAGQCH